MASIKDIQSFANSEARNKIVLCSELIDGLTYVDVGYQMAKALADDPLLMSQGSKLLNLALDCSVVDPSLDMYLAIQNIGILFEPELHFNLQAIIEKYSKGQTLIISAPGIVENGIFHYVNKDSGFEISLKEMTYKSV